MVNRRSNAKAREMRQAVSAILNRREAFRPAFDDPLWVLRQLAELDRAEHEEHSALTVRSGANEN